MDFLSNTTHLHVTTWVVGIILFLVAAFMAVDSKGRKVTHMIARLFYVLILLSGAFLFFRYSGNDSAMYGVKFLLGLITIGLMEMILIRSSKGNKVSTLWIAFAIVLIGTIALGFYLPGPSILG